MSIQSSIFENKAKTFVIMSLFVVFITTVSYVFVRALGYNISLVGIALVVSGLTSIASYYYSDKLVLATSGAKPIKKENYPALFGIIENLAKGDNLPMPKVYMINDTSSNAFATGRNPQNAVVCVTNGLLEKLNKVELEGVIAHELSHVRNYDIRLMGIVAILVGFVALLSNIFMQNIWFGGIRRNNEREGNSQNLLLLIGIIFALLSPIIATLIQLAISRKREFLADASGALLTKYPEGLASALEKLAKDQTTLKTANNATAHLFIVNPFKGKNMQTWLISIFNTHPPIEERIRMLRSM